jgi:HAD superfamily hydrolase (TIGR01509 family)
MDDLLVRSGALWKVAEVHLLERLGSRWTQELSLKYRGMNALDVARVIHGELSPSLSLAECQRIMRSRLIQAFKSGVEAMPGAAALVRHVRGRYPLAVASGSPLEAIRGALGHISILDCFDRVITSESVGRGKPHPDVFLEAARQLDCPPAYCLVLEDSLIGVQAAAAAGMQCFAVPSCYPQEIAKLATRVFARLDEIIPEL